MFASRLRNLRENIGLTQEELGKKINLVKSNISMYEKGNRIPNVEILEQMSELFDVSIDYLLGRTDIKQYNKPFDNELDKNLYVKTKKLDNERKKAVLNIVELLGNK